jgi:hypothetical protein
MRERRAMYMRIRGADGDAEARNGTGAGSDAGDVEEVKVGLGVPVF